MKETEEGMNPILVMALTSYLENFEPVKPDDDDDMNILLRTTEALERELEDMVEAQPGEVATLMMQAGYSIVYRTDGKHGWAMRLRRR